MLVWGGTGLAELNHGWLAWRSASAAVRAHAPGRGELLGLIEPALLFLVDVTMLFAPARRCRQGATRKPRLPASGGRIPVILLSRIPVSIARRRLHLPGADVPA